MPQEGDTTREEASREQSIRAQLEKLTPPATKFDDEAFDRYHNDLTRKRVQNEKGNFCRYNKKRLCHYQSMTQEELAEDKAGSAQPPSV